MPATSLLQNFSSFLVQPSRYNYEVKELGEVITFSGLYKADKGQAAAVTFYTFIGGYPQQHLKLT